MPEAHVAITVEKMLYADLRGIDSHGCCMLPFYQQLWRRRSRLNAEADRSRSSGRPPPPRSSMAAEGWATSPATLAMERAIEKSRAGGVGVVAVRNSGHYGAAARTRRWRRSAD